MQCDASECDRDAVTILTFRDQPGHVHVCSRDEAIDREWCDVTSSRPMPCPTGCETTPNIIGQATPTPL